MSSRPIDVPDTVRDTNSGETGMCIAVVSNVGIRVGYNLGQPTEELRWYYWPNDPQQRQPLTTVLERVT